ncbi:hypothetical protein [Streptomyces sp. NPDC050535]|uniref:hypothetical protein n=1 Tax=Streptomyces sp. NPDC050535 TaxID=3365626 RepID=UPI00379F3361
MNFPPPRAPRDQPVPPNSPWSNPASTGVVLYTTSPTSQTAAHTLAALRDFAEQQGWTVAHEAYDLAPLHVALRLRTGWRTVERTLATGESDGLLAPSEHEVATTPAEQTALRGWLLSLPAFAAYPHAGAPGSAVTAPIDREWSHSYAMTPVSLRRLRSDARMRLTLLRWPGNIPTAIEVLSRLAHNALVHARPDDERAAAMTVRLAVLEDDVLLVDVEDPRPEFPDSKAAIAGGKGNGLRSIRLLDATLTWHLSEGNRTKTVRAHLRPGTVSP